MTVKNAISTEVRENLFAELNDAGFSLWITECEKLWISPASKLTDDIRQVVKENKEAIRQKIIAKAAWDNSPIWPMVYDAETAKCLDAAMVAMETETARPANIATLAVLKTEDKWGNFWHEYEGFLFICDGTDYGYIKRQIAGKSLIEKRLAMARYSFLFLDTYKQIDSIAKSCCVANTWLRTGQIKGKDCPD